MHRLAKLQTWTYCNHKDITLRIVNLFQMSRIGTFIER